RHAQRAHGGVQRTRRSVQRAGRERALRPPRDSNFLYCIVMSTTRNLLASLAAASLVATAAAQSDESVIELAPFTVVADGAQSVFNVTQRDLAQRQASDLEDALSIDPSVTVGGSTAIAQKIYVRNLGEGLLNVSVDGATQA